MDVKPDLGAIAATAVSGAAAQQLAGIAGVVLMGCAWGTLYAVFKAPPMTRKEGLRFMAVRAFPSLALSWLLTIILNGALEDLHRQVEQTALMLSVSFYIASPKETTELLRELLVSVWQLRRVFNRTKE